MTTDEMINCIYTLSDDDFVDLWNRWVSTFQTDDDLMRFKSRDEQDKYTSRIDADDVMRIAAFQKTAFGASKKVYLYIDTQKVYLVIDPIDFVSLDDLEELAEWLITEDRTV